MSVWYCPELDEIGILGPEYKHPFMDKHGYFYYVYSDILKRMVKLYFIGEFD